VALEDLDEPRHPLAGSVIGVDVDLEGEFQGSVRMLKRAADRDVQRRS
jgi:hypothetical protein